MTYDDRLLTYWSSVVTHKLAEDVKNHLLNQTDMTTGDDTCLKNNWEEYCLQVQYEESIAWDFFIAHIHLLFEQYFDELPIEERITLWRETEEGQEWYWHNENWRNNNDDIKYEKVPLFFEDCIPILMRELDSIAIDYESDNITNYIEYNCEGMENDLTEEDIQ